MTIMNKKSEAISERELEAKVPPGLRLPIKRVRWEGNFALACIARLAEPGESYFIHNTMRLNWCNEYWWVEYMSASYVNELKENDRRLGATVLVQKQS